MPDARRLSSVSLDDVPTPRQPEVDESAADASMLSPERNNTGEIRGPEVAGSDGGKDQKRENIIRELVTTERGFLKDMEVLMEVYAMPASESKILTEKELRSLFSNLDVIISTSRALLELLEAAVGAPDQWIGEAFNQMMKKVESTYCEYCKHNEAAMVKLAEFASPDCAPEVKQWLKDCRAQLEGRTGAWDLGSLVIKPVQRVLKYPLLIKQLLKETQPDHPDFEQLAKAATDIELVAEKINEVKKRKDIVEKYVDGKGNVNVIHGFTKKWTRGTQQFKKATGFSDEVATSDALYDALIEKLDQQLRNVQQLSLELQTWLGSMKQVLDTQEDSATALEDLYGMDRDSTPLDGVDNYFTLQEYQKACVRFAISAWQDADNQVKSSLLPSLDQLLKMFEKPQMVIRKREKKLLDYERVMAIKARGEQVDKVLNESAEAYISIHGQLIEELPRFLDLVAKYIDVVAVHIAALQAKLHSDIAEQLKPIVAMFESNDSIVDGFRAAMAPGSHVEFLSRDIRLLSRWRDGIWENAPTSAGPDPMFDSYLTSRPAGLARSQSSLSETKSRSNSNTFLRSHTPSPGVPYNLIDVDDRALASPSPGLSAAPLSRQFQALTPSPYGSIPSTNGPSSYAFPKTVTTTPPRPVIEVPPRTTPSPPIGFEAVALYDFEADLVEEVDLKEGDHIRVLESEGRGGDWWFGIVNGREGWFPGTYVERVGD